jgi:glutamyl-tRNA synthetase
MFYGEPDARHTEAALTPEVRSALTELAERLAATDDWRQEKITAALQGVLDEHRLKMPKLAMPIRKIVFGLEQTPNLSSVLALAGKQRVLTRMRERLSVEG